MTSISSIRYSQDTSSNVGYNSSNVGYNSSNVGYNYGGIVGYSPMTSPTATSIEYWEYNQGTSTAMPAVIFSNRRHSAAVYAEYRDGTWGANVYTIPEATPAEKLRKLLQERMSPMIITDRKPILSSADIREIRARDTLRKVIGEGKYRNFLRQGFVSVRAKSGFVYQIYPGHGMTSVYNNGNMVERLCVVLSGDFPPTDSLIMRYLLVLNNEESFRAKANKSGPVTKPRKTAPVFEPLTQVFKRFKLAAA